MLAAVPVPGELATKSESAAAQLPPAWRMHQAHDHHLGSATWQGGRLSSRYMHTHARDDHTQHKGEGTHVRKCLQEDIDQEPVSFTCSLV